MFLSIVPNLNLRLNLNRSKITSMSLQELKEQAFQLTECDRYNINKIESSLFFLSKRGTNDLFRTTSKD